jgi:hypothetical protein
MPVANGLHCAGKTDLIPAETFASAASKKSLHGLFPPNRMRSISCNLNASIVMLRTKLMWTPSPRWTPAQLRQMKTPNLGDAHCGDGAPQSAQRSLPLDFWISRSCREGQSVFNSTVVGTRESWLDNLPSIVSQDQPPTWLCWPCCSRCELYSRENLKVG